MELHTAAKDLGCKKVVPKDKFHDPVLCELDCAIIEYMHQKIEEQIQKEEKAKEFNQF